ncbi:unnamed protein product (macronuclear) [Paramecium tetraurelia]|uniref:Casein kinase I n=1 Tax=Paramecium tetraurelia TaxID=5888 RepID=A0D6P5_PARTE|nr:uncharacterized protein GSPATT00001753001 [Paramecium tetraurelia]CAK78712.1 unnamed protein product [Paramecium tetraurelia]|eukprot:XP_001446109.1 hypothetical protein (macronuclear) [Paramecium tetraurelia strain d4-2]
MKSLRINNQYILSRKIASGAFGFVMLGFDQKTGQQVAIKIEKPENQHIRSIEKEVDIIQKLEGVSGVPKLLYSGKEDDFNVLVLQLLSKDLSTLIKQQKKFSLKTILQIGIKLVEILEDIHQKGVLHRDLKPENIMIDEKNKFYIIDYGISKTFLRKNGAHLQNDNIIRPFKDRQPFIGTSRYASIAAHKGNELGRKDDLESLIYILLYFYLGKLPWQNIKHVPSDQKIQKVGDIKQKQTTDLFRNLPEELRKTYEYLRKLTYVTQPDYKSIIILFQQAAKNAKITIDSIYDWDIQNTAQTEIYSHYGTIQFDDSVQIDKYQSNQLINIKQQNNNQNKRKTVCPSLIKETNNQNLYQFGRDQSGQSSPMVNLHGINQLSRDEISEDTEYIIPEELQQNQNLRVRTLPDYLKKPKMKQNPIQTLIFDEDWLMDSDNHLMDNYKKLQSLSNQITTIFHNKQK